MFIENRNSDRQVIQGVDLVQKLEVDGNHTVLKGITFYKKGNKNVDIRRDKVLKDIYGTPFWIT